MTEGELSNSSNIIGRGTSLNGDLHAAGNLRIEGKVEGNLHSKAKIVLGDTSWVGGNLVAQNAEIGGEVKGTVRVSGLLILKPTAVVNGDIVTSKLVFEEGAKFNGKCNMGDPVKEPLPSRTHHEVHKKNGSAMEPTLSQASSHKKGEKAI